MTAISLPFARLVEAQDSSGLTLELTPSTTKAKIGDEVTVTARVANTGTVTISGVVVDLGLPDNLDSVSVTCPGNNGGLATSCAVGDLAPGSVVEIEFVVVVASRETTGPVAAQATSGGTVLATASTPPFKITGPRRK